jgi:hypothetical protein
VTAAGVGTNRYSYGFNDPVNMRDPGGNYCLPCAVPVVEVVKWVGVSVLVSTGIWAINSEEMSPGIGHNGGPEFGDDEPQQNGEPPKGPSFEDALAVAIVAGIFVPDATQHGTERGEERGIPGIVQGDVLLSSDSISMPSRNDTTVVYNETSNVTVIVSNETGAVVTAYRGMPGGSLGKDFKAEIERRDVNASTNITRQEENERPQVDD